MAPTRILAVLRRLILGIDACRDMTGLVTREKDGVLALSERARLRFHLAGCHGCSAYRRQLHLTVNTLGRIPIPGVSPTTKRFLLQQFQARQKS
jgi:putative zinc finger protein